MFARLGAWCHDRRKLVLGLWAAALVLGLALARTVGGAFREEFNLPASQLRYRSTDLGPSGEAGSRWRSGLVTADRRLRTRAAMWRRTPR